MPKSSPRSNGPSEIAPGVFIGARRDADRFEGVWFCVLDEAPPDLPDATHIPLLEAGTGAANRSNLDRLVRGIRQARAEGRPVLIYCGHGIRRSPLGGAWYLRAELGLPLEAAFDRIAAVRPQVERPREWLTDADSLG